MLADCLIIIVHHLLFTGSFALKKTIQRIHGSKGLQSVTMINYLRSILFYMLMLILLACVLFFQANIRWMHVSEYLNLSIYCTFKWLIYWCTWHQIRYCIADMTHYKDGKVIIFSFTYIIQFFFLLDIVLINSSKFINGLYFMVVTRETKNG